MSKKTPDAETQAKYGRIIVFVEGGVADARMDSNVMWELIDWDNIKAGDLWTSAQIDALEEWGKGLVSADCIARLREYTAAGYKKLTENRNE